jgi:hypothetical protein
MQVAQLFGTFVVFLMGIIGSARGAGLVKAATVLQLKSKQKTADHSYNRAAMQTVTKENSGAMLLQYFRA